MKRKVKAGEGQLWLTDEAVTAAALHQRGECVVFCLTEKNRQDSLPGIAYCVELPEEMADKMAEGLEDEAAAEAAGLEDWLSADYLEKVWQRHVGKPWHILDTKRLSLREMTEEDVDMLYRLHADEEAARFLFKLKEDPEAERERTRSYIKNMYGFYEYGLWMAELREAVRDAKTGAVIAPAGTIIGQAGLQNREGFDVPELGYVILPEFRRQGYAKEACRGVLEYAFAEPENAGCPYHGGQGE